MLSWRPVAFVFTAAIATAAILLLAVGLADDAPRVRPADRSDGQDIRPPIVSIRPAPQIAKVAVPPKNPKTSIGADIRADPTANAVADPVIEPPTNEIENVGGIQQGTNDGQATPPPTESPPQSKDDSVDDISG